MALIQFKLLANNMKSGFTAKRYVKTSKKQDCSRQTFVNNKWYYATQLLFASSLMMIALFASVPIMNIKEQHKYTMLFWQTMNIKTKLQ